MNEKDRKEIVTMISGIILRKYGQEHAAEINGIVDEVINGLRDKIRSAKDKMEEEAMNRLQRRFTNEIEPMLEHLGTRIENLLAGDSWSGDRLATLAQQELTYAIRERAKEWAKKVAFSTVRFNFDDVFED